MDESRMTEKLRQLLTAKRFKHSLAVRNEAVRLAQYYNCNVQKAAIAGLLHDCAKDLRKRQMLQLCNEFGIVLDDICKKEKQLIHGPLGASIAKEQFEIQDEDILEAIYFHTTAKEGMTILTKIIYLADYIEPGRHFYGVESIRAIAYHNLNKAVLAAIDSTIKHVIAKGRLIHPRTIEARNHILLYEQ